MSLSAAQCGCSPVPGSGLTDERSVPNRQVPTAALVGLGSGLGGGYSGRLELHIEIDREDDGRWLAEIIDVPGVMAYGPTREAAILAVKALALRVFADKLERGELGEDYEGLAFVLQSTR